MEKKGFTKIAVGLFFLSVIAVLLLFDFFPHPVDDIIGLIPEGNLKAIPEETAVERLEKWLSRDFTPEKKLLDSIRFALATGTDVNDIGDLNIDLEPSYAQVTVTLFQQGNEPIRFISKRQNPVETFNRIVEKLREHSRFSDFDISDVNKCRIMLEVVTSQRELDINKLREDEFSENRFEPGITGLKFRYHGVDYSYMPTDAAVNSHLTIQQALNYISKAIGVAEETNSITERVNIIQSLPIEWHLIESVAFITYGCDLIPLYRGYPAPITFSRGKVLEMTKASMSWILDNMDERGRFLYYYDGAKDSVTDFLHPDRNEQDNYYNILRHNGGIIALVQMDELTGKSEYLRAAQKALDYLVLQLRREERDGKEMYYTYYNDKAKLGGSGTALIAFMNYYKDTGSSKYNEYVHGLAEHIISRIAEDGEMLGYYIHPQFNNGLPILNPTEEEKKRLFSFYYPGEALFGLALYEQNMDLSDEAGQRVRASMKKALDFLIEDRPVKYADLFTALPSDGWLMQAVEQLSVLEEFQKAEYFDFVFNDAEQMIEHMYTGQNSPYYDYPGTFYYSYGDHAYPDSARAEGLIAAYYLAKKTGKVELADYLLENCELVAKSLMPLYNSEASTYMHINQVRSVGTFKLKFTRQWVRIDTVQHTVCFFMRLMRAWDAESN